MATALRSKRGFDWLLFLVFLCLIGTGLVMVYATTYNDFSSSMWNISSPFGRQLLWAVASIVIMLFLSAIDWQVWNTLALPLYSFGIVLLIVLLIFGTETKGAQSWLRIGSFSLQPSEFVKLTTIILTANLLSSIRIRLTEPKSQMIVFGVLALPAFLIILQPDPGSALTFGSLLILTYRKGLSASYYIALLALFSTLVFSFTFGFYLVFSVVFLIGTCLVLNFDKARYMAILLVLTLILVNILTYQNQIVYYSIFLNFIVFLFHLWRFSNNRDFYSKFFLFGNLLLLCLISFSSSYAFSNILKPHQQDRINVWLQPEKCDPRGSLYNLLQSKLAIGSGGLNGKGFLEGNLTKLNYVPEQTTDFIFSSVGEEQGFIGSAALIILFMIMVFRMINIGEASKHSFVLCVCYGVAGFIFLHFFLNIGMTMGLCPVIGIPLPFISKGGSSLMAFSMMVGIVLNMSKERK
ncbi:MAG: rod shape determining protein RodA [Saprospiraceae bacterium]|jgi:rod shape determining protein RodA